MGTALATGHATGVAAALHAAEDVRRREFLDPALLHSGPEGIQRMADAVSLGGNPMNFAAGHALIASLSVMKIGVHARKVHQNGEQLSSRRGLTCHLRLICMCLHLTQVHQSGSLSSF